MLPGFVTLGVLAVLSQLLLVGGFYGYLGFRYRVTDASARRRVAMLFAAGTTLAVLGQLAAFGGLGSLWVSPALSFRQALLVRDAGLALALVGYLLVGVGVVLHGRARE